jgi:hypothetical protein
MEKIISQTNPSLIKKDFNRKIVLSHSTGNKLRLSTEGVYIETYASTGVDVGKRTGEYGFSQDGNLVLSGKELFYFEYTRQRSKDKLLLGQLMRRVFL